MIAQTLSSAVALGALAFFTSGLLLAESESGSVQVKPRVPQVKSDPDGPARVLKGRVFQWAVTYPGEGAPIKPETPSDYRLHFATLDRITLKADCNQYAASVRLTGSVFSAGEMIGTRALCSKDSLEREFIDGIKASTGWQLKDDVRLILTRPHDTGAMHLVEVTGAVK